MPTMAPALSKVAAGSSSQPPKAASEPDCTAKHADAADCSDKVMAAQWRKRAGRVLFPEVLPVCNGRREACERPLDGLRSPYWVSTLARNTGTRRRPDIFEVRYRSHTGLNHSDITPSPFRANFNCEPCFLLHGLSYMRDLSPQRAECPQKRIGYVDGGGGFLVQRPHLTLDRRKRGQAFQPGNGMVNRLTTPQSTVAMRRWGPPAIAMLAAMAALTAMNADAAARQARRAPPTEARAPRDAGEPIMAIVSIKTQQVTFYDADGWILRAPVSTGITGRETPAGVFAVLEKQKSHHSTLYDDAWMPNMQRITWNGLALHGGPLPGHAASHGCVRMPYVFAKKLFEKTKIGMRVIISPNDAAPVEFSHPALFVPNAEAVAAAPARAETLAHEAEEAAKTADEAKKAAATAARETASLTASLRKLEWLKTRADAELAFAGKTLAAAKTDQAKARAGEQRQKAALRAAEAGTQLDTAK